MVIRRRALLLSCLTLALHLKRQKRMKKRVWVHDINSEASKKLGEYEIEFLDKCSKSRKLFIRYLRMTPERYQQLLNKVRPSIEKKDTNFRKAIPAGKRLVITLRFLSRGIPQETLATNFRIGYSTVCGE